MIGIVEATHQCNHVSDEYPRPARYRCKSDYSENGGAAARQATDIDKSLVAFEKQNVAFF